MDNDNRVVELARMTEEMLLFLNDEGFTEFIFSQCRIMVEKRWNEAEGKNNA